jgi:hypothetical protein
MRVQVPYIRLDVQSPLFDWCLVHTWSVLIRRCCTRCATRDRVGLFQYLRRLPAGLVQAETRKHPCMSKHLDKS